MLSFTDFPSHFAFSPRLLTDLVVNTGVESLECLVQCKGDVTTILKQGDLLDLCEKVLRVSQWDWERNKRIGVLRDE